MHINNTTLTRVGSTFEEKTIKFVGLNIDDQLTLKKKHISQICSKMFALKFLYQYSLLKKSNTLYQHMHEILILFTSSPSYSKLPISFQNFFVQNTHAINLRNNQTVYHERAPTKVSLKTTLMQLAITPKMYTVTTVYVSNVMKNNYVIKFEKSITVPKSFGLVLLWHFYETGRIQKL